MPFVVRDAKESQTANTSIGIRRKALEWFSSYLLGGNQGILFDGVKSDSFDLRFEVPQGRCLGLLLFVLYTSKLFEIIQAHLLDALCFADDTQLYLSFKPNSRIMTGVSCFKTPVLYITLKSDVTQSSINIFRLQSDTYPL